MPKRSLKIFPILLGIILVIIALTLAIQREQSLPPGISYSEMQESVKLFAGTFRSFESMEDPEKVKEASVIYDQNGKKLPLTHFDGKVVVLNFWATWCAPCVKELPLLAVLKETRPDIEVIAVSLDLNKKPDELRAFLDKNHADTLAVFIGRAPELDTQFPNRGLPTTYVITPENRIIYKMEGDTDWSSSNALTFLDFVKTQN